MRFDPALETTVGSWLQLADPSLTEMMARAGFDWLTIDLEHTSTTMSQAADLIRIGDLAGVPMFARLAGHDPSQIKRILDAGASGIIAPMVNTPDQAKAIVDAAFYPPQGSRGVGLARAQSYGTGFETYRDQQANDIVVMVQIEHVDGVRNLESILSVEGVSGFFVGPYDLSGSLGRPGDFDHPAVTAALAEIERFVTPDGPVAGIHVVEPNVERLQEAIDRGYRFVSFASDMLIFSHRIAEITTSLAGLR
ncbi:MAG: aldolase/citrate lyase family protein [Actinomycetota bacterium]|nr:aldolase/citrate lyase family protein [Actinomycetota bacterium]